MSRQGAAGKGFCFFEKKKQKTFALGSFRWACVHFVLAGCAVGPDFKRPAAPAGAGFTAANLRDTAATMIDGGRSQRFVTDLDIPAQWWALFRSPELDRLVTRAIAANPNLDAARAALRQAHELAAAQWTSFLPVVTANASAQRAKNANSAVATPVNTLSPYYSLYTGQLNVSYAPDVFGATRRTVEAARAQEEATRFQLEAVYLTLASNVVVTAIQAASLREQVAATRRLLALQHALTEKTRGQRRLGTASELDILTQEAAEAATAQTLPPLQKQAAQAQDALAALLGRVPADQPEASLRLADLTLPADLPVSLPSKLVEQRPDIRQAEANLHAATAQVGIAIANMLPQISLSADIGTSALHTGELFAPGFGFWTLGTSATQTIFDAGALLHKRRAADAAMQQAAAQYRATVIGAFQNVADALRALQTDADALKSSADSEVAAQRSFELARRQFGLGTVSEVTMMAAEQNYRQATLALVQAQASRYADTAGLFEALGGGWWNRPLEAQNESPGATTR
jgi:NodT family efflux transporter outer membrane factor (OMF) lipoprotein